MKSFEDAMKAAGRICPVDYRYHPSAFAREAEFRADTAYVVGGLYRNRPALDAIERLVVKEPGEASVVFNGDFHWFDATPELFLRISIDGCPSIVPCGAMWKPNWRVAAILAPAAAAPIPIQSIMKWSIVRT